MTGSQTTLEKKSMRPRMTGTSAKSRGSRRFSLSCLALSILALAGSISWAQAGTSISGQQILTAVGTIAANVPVYVCPYNAVGTPCYPQSAIYADPGLTQPLTQPTTTNQYGQITAWVASGTYQIQALIGFNEYLVFFNTSASGGPTLPLAVTSGGTGASYSTQTAAGVALTNGANLTPLNVQAAGVHLLSQGAVQTGFGPLNCDYFNYPDGTNLNGQASQCNPAISWIVGGAGNAIIENTLMTDSGAANNGNFYASLYNANSAGDYNCQVGDFTGCITTMFATFVVLPATGQAGPASCVNGATGAAFIATDDTTIASGVHNTFGQCGWQLALRSNDVFTNLDNGGYQNQLQANGTTPYTWGYYLDQVHQAIYFFLPDNTEGYYQGNNSSAPACVLGAGPQANWGCYSSAIATLFGRPDVCPACTIYPKDAVLQENPKGAPNNVAGAQIEWASIVTGVKTTFSAKYNGQGGGASQSDVTNLLGTAGGVWNNYTVVIPSSSQLLNVTAGSGGTITTSTCPLSGFNGGGTGALATVFFPTPGSWTSATFAVTSPGSGFTSAPTSATLGSPCLGTATITAALGGPGTYAIGQAAVFDGYTLAMPTALIEASTPITHQISTITLSEQSSTTTPLATPQVVIPNANVLSGGYLTNNNGGGGGTGQALLLVTTVGGVGTGNTINPVTVNVQGRGAISLPPNIVNINPSPGAAIWGVQATQAPQTNSTPFTFALTAPTSQTGNLGTVPSNSGGTYYTVLTQNAQNYLRGQYVIQINATAATEFLQLNVDGATGSCTASIAFSSGSNIIDWAQCSAATNQDQIQFRVSGTFSTGSNTVSYTVNPLLAGTPFAIPTSFTGSSTSSPLATAQQPIIVSPPIVSTGWSGTEVFTSTHVLASTDNNKLILMNCSAACNFTLQNAIAALQLKVWVQDIGSAVPTVVLSGGSTYNGSATVPVLKPYQIIQIAADNTVASNYVGDPPAIAGSNMTISGGPNGITYTAAAGTGLTGGAFDATGLTGNSAGNTVYAIPGGSAGTYLVNCYVVSTNVPTGATLPGCSVGWTDEDNSSSVTKGLCTTSTISVAGAVCIGSAGSYPGVSMVHAAQSTNITCSSTGYAAGSGTALQYALHCTATYIHQ